MQKLETSFLIHLFFFFWCNFISDFKDCAQNPEGPSVPLCAFIDDYNLMWPHRRPCWASSKLCFCKSWWNPQLAHYETSFLKEISIHHTAITPNTNWFWRDNEAAGASTQAFSVPTCLPDYLFIYLFTCLVVYLFPRLYYTRSAFCKYSVRVREGWNEN